MALGNNIEYVDFFLAPNNALSSEHPDIYLAGDGFHPSSKGYEIWFNGLKPALDAK